MKRQAWIVALGALLGCHSDSTSPGSAARRAEHSGAISDAEHSSGTPGFYFLPPVVDAPVISEVLDTDIGALNPRVFICDLGASADCGGATPALAVFTASSTPSLSVGAGGYHVNWNTKADAFQAGHVYRVHAYAGVAGSRRELGFADILLTNTPGQAKNVATNDVIVLNDGQTLPIKFWIGEHVPGSMAVNVSPASVPTGGGASATATVTDLHGNPRPNATVSWSASGPPVAIASASTITGSLGQATTALVAGMTAGTATLTATTAGIQASGALDIESPGELVVSVRTANAVMMFAAAASGNVAPLSVLQGSNTGLSQPYGVLRDPAGQLIVANYTANSVTMYAPGASGNASPTLTIQGPHTGLAGPVGIARGSNGFVYVANDVGQSIAVFAPSASGDATPVALIQGPQTLLSGPAGLALDQAGRLYVANTCCGPATSGNRVTVYAPGATGDVSPVAVIAGPNTGLQRPHGIAVSGTGELYVASSNGAAIQIFAAGSNGDIAPLGTIAGPATGLASPLGLAFAPDGSLLVVNWGPNSVLEFAAGSSGNASPVRVLSGPSTLLSDPMFVVLQP